LKKIHPILVVVSKHFLISKLEWWFQGNEALADIERCTVCGCRQADLRPDYSKQQAARQSVGWIIPPKV
jgi:hypothetical protein